VVTGTYKGLYYYIFRENEEGKKRFLFFRENLGVNETMSYRHFVEANK
jgi:hypothetical protein